MNLYGFIRGAIILAYKLGPTQFLLILAVLYVQSLALLYFAVRVGVHFYGAFLRKKNVERRRRLLFEIGISESGGRAEDRRLVVGFFHPYCDAGGGGERVLWTAIACFQREEPRVVSVIYTGDKGVTKDQIIEKVKNRFGIDLDPRTLAFIFLNNRDLVEDSRWKRFTLLGQSLGSMWLGLEALRQIVPDVYIDTMGYAFTFPVVRWLGIIPVGGYVHYPTISTNMLSRVQERVSGHTNASGVASSAILSGLKLFYYLIFSEFYSLSLRQSHILMVNSTWTKGHVNRLLRPLLHRDEEDDDAEDEAHAGEGGNGVVKEADGELRQRKKQPEVVDAAGKAEPSSAGHRHHRRAKIVYPPCDTHVLTELPLERRERIILSVAQFRPEKEHVLQLQAFHLLLESHPEYSTGEKCVKLVLAGSVRNEGDEKRVQGLKWTAQNLGISDNVEFVLNAPFSDLVKLFGRASIGLSTMVDEHFGINVVEIMAAGLIPLAHESGGPLLDIVVPVDGEATGFHATTASSFASRLHEILTTPEPELLRMRQRARKRAVSTFSAGNFERGWMENWEGLKGEIEACRKKREEKERAWHPGS